jgi:hypothetical protein
MTCTVHKRHSMPGFGDVMSVRRMNSNDGALHLRSRNRGGICGCNVGTICLHISVGATGTWPGPRADICAAMHANRYDGDVGLRLLCITSSSLPSTWPKWCTDALPCEEGDARWLASLFADACITCGWNCEFVLVLPFLPTGIVLDILPAYAAPRN